jgi:hypothetical protein
MARDFPRNKMPKGYAWNFVDWLPRIGGASVRERGGWTPPATTAPPSKAPPRM